MDYNSILNDASNSAANPQQASSPPPDNDIIQRTEQQNTSQAVKPQPMLNDSQKPSSWRKWIKYTLLLAIAILIAYLSLYFRVRMFDIVKEILN